MNTERLPAIDNPPTSWSRFEMLRWDAQGYLGATGEQAVEFVVAKGYKFSLPNLYQYMKLGFVPKAVRGPGTKRSPSKGFYPFASLLRIIDVKEASAEGVWTLEEISKGPLGIASRLDAALREFEKARSMIAAKLDLGSVRCKAHLKRLKDKRCSPSECELHPGGDAKACETYVSGVELIEERLKEIPSNVRSLQGLTRDLGNAEHWGQR